MKAQYHREITTQALGAFFHTEALETVIAANLGQDALRYQFWHDHFHYDGSAFSAGDAYCSEQHLLVVSGLQHGTVLPARQALGRLTHTVQDIYAHSNYVALWRENHPGLTAQEIDPELPDLLHNPRLHSGKLYYPIEALWFIKVLKPHVLPLLPRDSHAWMNMDDPARAGFDFAFAAAVKRTSAEYLRIASRLSPEEVTLLTGNPHQDSF